MPTTWDRSAFGIPLTILAFLGLLAIYVGVQVAFAVVEIARGGIDPHHPDQLSSNAVLTLQLATYVPVGAYVLVVLPRLANRSLSELGFRALRASDLGLALIGTVLMFLTIDLVGGVIAAAAHRRDVESAVALLGSLHTPFERIGFVLIAVLLAPMFEELLFRAFVYNALSRYLSFWPAALLSGVLFGLAHADPSAKGSKPFVTTLGSLHLSLPAQYVTISIPLALGGVVLAWVYARTRNYWASVVTHATFNTISTALLFLHIE